MAEDVSEAPSATPDLASNRLERYGQARLNETYQRLHDQLGALRTYLEVRLDAADTAIVAARNTTMTALQVAETEREKAAAALRTSLEREIESGDARLADHITHQIEQVQQALQALTTLLAERDGRMDDRFAAHQQAIQKAEDSLNKRLENMNQFRDQLKDQTSTFAVKEATEARLVKLESFQGKLLGAFGLAMIVMPLIIGLITYFLTRTAIPIDGLQQ